MADDNKQEQKSRDIGKRSIPISERCDDFERLWNMILDEVISYWNDVKD